MFTLKLNLGLFFFCVLCILIYVDYVFINPKKMKGRNVMTLQIFSIFDEKAQTFSRPMYMTHRGEALRAFSDVVEDEKSMIAKHPSDYKLYLLGSFDDCSGAFVSEAQPVFLANASDFVKVKE